MVADNRELTVLIVNIFSFTSYSLPGLPTITPWTSSHHILDLHSRKHHPFTNLTSFLNPLNITIRPLDLYSIHLFASIHTWIFPLYSKIFFIRPNAFGQACVFFSPSRRSLFGISSEHQVVVSAFSCLERLARSLLGRDPILHALFFSSPLFREHCCIPAVVEYGPRSRWVGGGEFPSPRQLRPASGSFETFECVRRVRVWNIQVDFVLKTLYRSRLNNGERICLGPGLFHRLSDESGSGREYRNN